MKKFLITTVSILSLSTASFAGTLSEPEVETEVTEQPAASSSGWVLPLLIIGAAALVLTQQEQNQASDIRLKRNIKHIGTAQNGLPIYEYNYVWSKKKYQGVMAQDVLKHTPSAVKKGLFGVLAVNYAKLGLSLKAV